MIRKITGYYGDESSQACDCKKEDEGEEVYQLFKRRIAQGSKSKPRTDLGMHPAKTDS